MMFFAHYMMINYKKSSIFANTIITILMYMKRHLLLILIACICCSLRAQITETATEAVRNMGLGWNLGNTLDANNCTGKDFTVAGYWGQQGLESETCWGQPKTRPELMAMMKKGGFGAIRVPVTWFNHMDKDGKVDAAWMKRVHEVVDYVIDNGLYCIINVHHDNGADGDSRVMWMHADEDNYNVNKKRYEYLWTQIAEEFKDYDHHLLFAGYNEMLDKLNSWCFASFSASGQYNSTIANSAYKALNSYAQSFVNAVRATGGNNATRNLVVQTYASSNGYDYDDWNAHLTDPVKNMQLPKDEAKNHIIFEVHAYPSIISNNGSNRPLTTIKNYVNKLIKGLKDNLASKGAPVIFGEWGTSNVDAGDGKTDYEARRSLMFQFCEYFVQQTKANGMGTFYWMGISDGNSRYMEAQQKSYFSQPDLAECLAKAYHGSTFKGDYPSMKFDTNVCFEGEKKIAWGDGITITADLFKAIEGEVKLDITFKFVNGGKDNEPDIQLFDANWKKKPSFIINGKTYDGDFNPQELFNADDADPHQITLTFDSSTNAALKTSGLIIHGNNVTLYKVVLSSVNASSIESIDGTDTPQIIHDLNGNRIKQPRKGINIINGQKLLVR